MMHDLEAPCAPDSIDWSRLYRARSDEVVAHRPYFTGDVFENVEVQNPDGSTKRKNIIIVQHPCAMRTNGVDLVPKLLVAELRNHRVLSPEQWTGVVIPTSTYNKATSGVYEEADLIEEWCEERLAANIPPEKATAECVTWLGEEVGGVTRQRMLEEEQNRSQIRKQMRLAIRSLV